MKSTISAITRQFVLSGKTVAIAISLLTLAASGTELNIYTTFITFAWMSFLHIALFDLVVTVKILAELSTSLNRIQDFLTLQESQVGVPNPNQGWIAQDDKIASTQGHRGDADQLNKIGLEDLIDEKSSAVRFEQVCCYWVDSGSEHRPALHEVSFTVSKSELVVVTGRVGSGKSSLLLAISGELLKSKGRYHVLEQSPTFRKILGCSPVRCARMSFSAGTWIPSAMTWCSTHVNWCAISPCSPMAI